MISAHLRQRLALSLIGLYIVLMGAQPATAGTTTSQAASRECASGLSLYESWSRDLPCSPPLMAIRDSISPTSPSPLPETVEDASQYTDLAFASFRDGNWEIYYEDDPWISSSMIFPHRVTNDPAADLRPALRPGTRQIAFASNRTGNYELYMVDWDGSGLKALTNHPDYDSQPAWTLDGSKLAFVSNRDGNLEIYTMLADGSGLTRQTFDAADDFNPSWSPDGSELIWVRAVSDVDGVIYRMPAGSSSPLALTPPLRYAQHPIWSPKIVAFDYDGTGDGWNDLGLMMSDGSQLRVQAPSQGTQDNYTGAWSYVDADQMIANRITYILYGGYYYVDRACLSIYYTYLPSLTCLNYSNLDFYPSVGKIDITAPVSEIYPIPRYQRAGPAAITVNGSDAGLAGLYAVWVEQRNGLDNDWELAFGAVSPVPLPYTAYVGLIAGKTTYFRSRAQDKADNFEAWPPGNGDTFTHVYTWELDGQVNDNRGSALPYTMVTSTPVFDDQTAGRIDGSFHRYVPTQPVTVTVSQPGYGDLPATRLSSLVDLSYSWVLPPAQDQLKNGNYESSLDYWFVGGEYPPVASPENHTGLAGAQLGPSLGGKGESIAVNTSGYDPHIVADSAGDLHVIWSGNEGGYVDSVYYSRQLDSGVWSLPVKVNPDQVNSSTQLSLAISPDDSLHAVWLDYTYQSSHVMYASKPAGGSWTIPVDLSGERYIWSPVENANPEILVDSKNALHLMFADQDGLWYLNKPSGGSWSAPFRLNWFSEHSMALDALDNLHVVYQDIQLTHRLRSADGQWDDATMVGIDLGYRLSTAVDSSERLHLIYTYDQVLYHTYRQPGGGWTYPEPVSDVEYIYAPALAVSDGIVHIAWDSQQGLAYRRQFGSGEWSTTFYTPATFYSLDFIVQGEQVQAVYGDQALAQTIYSTWSLPQQGASRLAQAVTIPSDMHQPTLSFYYEVEQAGAYSFTVAISDTLLLSRADTTPGWEHVWVDMSPWAGKTVSVTFEAENDLLQNILIARVDDVSLGAWTTPLVGGLLPQKIDANVTTAITLTGENFLPIPQVLLNGQSAGSVTWLDENTLRVDFPVGVPPGRYEIRVVNPGGAFGVWDGILNVGKQLYLPAIMR